jgi:hypothetical protein
MGHWFDDAARGLAAGTHSRRDVLRVGGKAAGGALVATLTTPIVALAAGKHKCPQGHSCGSNELCCENDCCDKLTEQCCDGRCVAKARKCCRNHPGAKETLCLRHEECCGGSCYDPDTEECCNASDGERCPPGQCCGDEGDCCQRKDCCDNEICCSKAKPKCCHGGVGPESNPTCCASSDTCCQGKNGWRCCGPGKVCCGGKCCPKGKCHKGVCGECGTSHCAPGQACCNPAMGSCVTPYPAGSFCVGDCDGKPGVSVFCCPTGGSEACGTLTGESHPACRGGKSGCICDDGSFCPQGGCCDVFGACHNPCN